MTDAVCSFLFLAVAFFLGLITGQLLSMGN